MKVTIEVTIDDELLAGLLVSAIDSGGISYWCESVEFEDVDGVRVGGTGWEGCERYWAPFQKGALVVLCEGKKHRLDRAAFEKALQLMPSVLPHTFADMVQEDYDIHTADVFVQLACFGEIVYG